MGAQDMETMITRSEELPEFGYKGYVYCPCVKDDIVNHDIYSKLELMSVERMGSYPLPKFSNASIPNVSNVFLTEEQFRNFIDMIEHITYTGL
tara:strand:- start:107 stop:385 length:279 start_codon:yes stop_codon:yes gene_type:complete